MELLIRWFVLMLLISLSACSTLQVTTDYDHDASFKKLSNYAWLEQSALPEGNRHIDNKVLDQQIRGSVNKSLANKGFKLQDSDKPSFLIGYNVAIDQKTSINTVSTRTGNQPEWNANAWRGTTDLGQHNFEQGTIIIEIVNADSNELIWRANASAEIDPYANTKKRLQRIENAIVKMLRDFPPNR